MERSVSLDTSPSTTYESCMRWPAYSSTLHSGRASAFHRWRPWPAGVPSLPLGSRLSPRWPEGRRFSWTRPQSKRSPPALRACGATRRSAAATSNVGSNGPASSRGSEPPKRRRKSMTTRCRNVALVALGMAACVSYDPAGPPVPRIDGTYSATIVTTLANTIELRSDTFTAALTVRGTGYRGQFVGTYDIARSDSGPFAGVVSPDGSVVVTNFGTPPKPIAGVAFIRNLYPWCDFPRLGTGPML